MIGWTPERVAKNFKPILDAALAGERCPMTSPHGPIESGAIGKLTELGMIRSEVSGHNYRRVVILQGEHAGKATAADPYGREVWCVDGKRVERGTYSPSRVTRPQPSPPQLLKKSYG